jgi:putative heme-binding domain-containing protein
MRSSDGNFRPVDLEFAPDGSLYVVDWHNPLIGHMQHNARDPHRDHDHGRIYRITYPSRPLVTPPEVEGAPLAVLLENLKLPEYRARYRTRRELRGRDPEVVLPALRAWVEALDPTDPGYEHHRLEALWVSWGLDRIDEALLRELLASEDHRARAAAVRAVRYSDHRLDDRAELLVVAAADAHPRVQMEAITAGSWLEPEEGLAVLDAAAAVHAPEETPEDPGHVVVRDGGRRVRLTHPALAEPVVSFRLTLPGDERTINLSEMVVTSGGADVTGSLGLSQSSEYNGGQYPIENLVDGDRGNFSHTSFEAEPWFEARLDPPAPIDSVELWNRQNFESRLDRARVEFRGADGVLATLEIRLDDGVGIFADTWLRTPYRTARGVLEGQPVEEQVEVQVPAHLPESLHAAYRRGAEIYARDGHCATCHQPDGRGLAASGFPPLAGTSWVTGDDERLIRVTLNGLMGPLELDGVTYPGLVPMTPFGDLLDDDELAAVLTYVRNAFGNRAPAVTARRVAEVREASAAKVGFYTPEELSGGAAGGGRRFVRLWSVQDLAEDLGTPLAGRDFERGRALFEEASCVTCHNLEGRGGSVGADLSRAGEEYPPLELLRQIVEPSAIVKPEHRLHRVELEDESVYVGLVVAESDATLVLAESLQEPDRTVEVPKAGIVLREELDLSPMPTGLLATLTREEVLDLLAYVAAGGDPDHGAFRSR